MPNPLKRLFGLRADGTPVPGPTPARLQDLKPGTVVVFVDETCNQGAPTDIYVHESGKANLYGREAVVVALTDYPGKPVALCFKKPVPGGHTCDGLVPEGHGWWASPEHLYTPDDWKAHQAASAVWRETRDAAASIAEKYLGG